MVELSSLFVLVFHICYLY